MRAPARILAAMAIALSASPAAAATLDALGTLFTTPQERERLDRLRRGEPGTQIGVDSAGRSQPTVTGFVRRSDGRNTVWIDGTPVAVRRPATGTVAPRSAGRAAARSATRSAAFPRRAILLRLFLLLCHVLNLCHQSGPLQGHQARGPQLHFGRFSAHHFADQVRAQFLEFAVARAAQNTVEAPLHAPRALGRGFAPGIRVAPVKAS